MKKYWVEERRFGGVSRGHEFELRGNIALMLIERFGAIAAKFEGEDTAGRQKLEMQEPKELVARCFAIAEEFVAVAEEKGLVRERVEEKEKQGAA